MAQEAKEENVKVVVRCRPLLKDAGEDVVAVDLESDEQTIFIATRQFTFDRVFGFNSSQIDVYTQAAKQIVDFCLQGYNGTVFAYGQTGTGKTFTASGILSHCFAHIFGFIAKSGNDTQFL
ncbi:Kinesin-like protein 4, partial [Leptotrombidium deliense]